MSRMWDRQNRNSRLSEELKVAFNYQFLMDPIANIDNDEIELKYGGQLQPGLITIPEDDDYLYVIMPVRLTE
jgi:DNA polymerase-3 subunit beta